MSGLKENTNDSTGENLKSAILNFLRLKSGQFSEHELLSLFRARKQSKVAALRSLVVDGDVKRTGDGVKARPYLYEAVSEPNSAPAIFNESLVSGEVIYL